MMPARVRDILHPNRWLAPARPAPRRPARQARHIVGVACTGHGASLAYMGADGTVRSSVLDRWAGVKDTLMFSADEDRALRHPTSAFDERISGLLIQGYGCFPETRTFETHFQAWLDWFLGGLDLAAADIDLVVTSDSHFATNWARLGEHLDAWFPRAGVVRAIEHHAIHQRQAFWQSGFAEAAVLTLDTCGESLERLAGRMLSGTIAHMDASGGCRVVKELLFPEMSIGLLYGTVNFHVGFRQGEEGKTMGLAAYGGPALFDGLEARLRLHADGGYEFLSPDALQAALSAYVPARRAGEPITARHADVAYAGQAILDRVVGNAFAAALRLTGAADLAYAGGVALNSVANDIAYRTARPRRLYVATNPGDTGHALGCALFGAYEVARWAPPLAEMREYLGPAYPPADLAAAAAAAAAGGYAVDEPADLAATVSRSIANGYIVARFDGGAEFGPRALGNRSILCDPRRRDMKAWLNARVKHREGFRPFAPTVLEEEAAAWFDLDGRSAYMLRVCQVRPERRDRIPAIVHVDGSARVQTLARHENPGYWAVIDRFHRLTGIPLVLNTSFNLAGKPIVETPADAVACFAATEIDVLALGPLVISKRPLAAYLDGERPQ